MKIGFIRFILMIVMTTLPAPVIAADAPQGKPNILLIVADDLGFSDIGAFGGEIETPNIDRIAAEGVRLSNFYAATTCSPTRAMLMSGADNHLVGLGNMLELLASNQTGMPGYEGYLNDRALTMAELLRDEGYATFISGKWHLGGEIDQSPNARGFDRSFIEVNGASSHYGHRLSVPPALLTGTPPVPDWREDGLAFLDPGANFYSSDVIAEKMIRYIYEGKRKPFFGYLSFTAPHWPLQARPDYIAKYDGRYDVGYDKIRAARFERQKTLGLVSADAELPPRAPGVPAWDTLTKEEKRHSAKRMAIYAAMVESMDANIGRILSFLERQDKLDNTLIVFLSDNGATSSFDQDRMLSSVTRLYDNSYENLGRRGSFAAYGPGWAQVSNTPFSGFKLQGAEGGVHVPAIVRTPGLPRAGDIDPSVLSVIDVLPTVMQAVGGKIPTKHFKGREIIPPSGVSFLDLARGDAGQITRPAGYIAKEITGARALRNGDWKLVGRAPPGKDAPVVWKIYNLASDPFELNDLSASHPEKREELINLWADYAQKSGYIRAHDFPLGPPPAKPKK